MTLLALTARGVVVTVILLLRTAQALIDQRLQQRTPEGEHTVTLIR